MGCRGVWGGLGIRGVLGYYGTIGVEKEGIPTWDNTYKMELHVPPIIVGVGLTHVGGLVKLSYLSWSAGVSCRTCSQNCGSWYFPRFLLSEGSFT